MKVKVKMQIRRKARKGQRHRTPALISGKNIITMVAQYNAQGIPDRVGLC